MYHLRRLWYVQGTSRPVHYHVLVDQNGFSADSLQMLCFRLCHLFCRATRSVSLIPPVRAAFLSCGLLAVRGLRDPACVAQPMFLLAVLLVFLLVRRAPALMRRGTHCHTRCSTRTWRQNEARHTSAAKPRRQQTGAASTLVALQASARSIRLLFYCAPCVPEARAACVHGCSSGAGREVQRSARCAEADLQSIARRGEPKDHVRDWLCLLRRVPPRSCRQGRPAFERERQPSGVDVLGVKVEAAAAIFE